MANINSIHIDKAENGCTVRCSFASDNGNYTPDENYVSDKKVEDIAKYFGLTEKEDESEAEESPMSKFSPKKFK